MSPATPWWMPRTASSSSTGTAAARPAGCASGRPAARRAGGSFPSALPWICATWLLATGCASRPVPQPSTLSAEPRVKRLSVEAVRPHPEEVLAPPMPPLPPGLMAAPRLTILPRPRFALIRTDNLAPGTVTVYLSPTLDVGPPGLWTPITTVRRQEAGRFEIRDYDHTNENRYYTIQITP